MGLRRNAVARHKRWIGTYGLVAMALTGFAGGSAHAELLVDNIMSEQFNNEKDPNFKKIVFFVDVYDPQGAFVKGLEKADDVAKVTIDGKVVEGTFSIETVKDANQPMAVGILIAAHESYSQFDPDSGMPNILELEKNGFEAFLKNLSTQNYAAVWYYNEDGLHRVYSWSNKPADAANTLQSLVKAAEKQPGKAPALYANIQKVMESVQDVDSTLPRRRILLVMSDGKDGIQNNPAQVKKRIDAIADLSATTRTKVYAIGFTIDLEEPLVNLNEIASRTFGVYRRLSADKADNIAVELENLSVELQNQYVVTFTPKEWRGADQPVTIVLEVTPPGLTPMQKIISDVKVPSLGAEIMKYVIWVLIGLGSLLGLFLIWKLIKAIIRARKNRPAAVGAEEEEFVGPYKGKLTCTMGAYAGREFFLTEDLTTIGSISGNTIVLQEAGVSKRHAGIKIEEMRFELADFGSTNGTFVNGAKITKQFLRDGDEVRIGEARMKFTLK
jgi:hypothetical protein